jgi:hypothetical protein
VARINIFPQINRPDQQRQLLKDLDVSTLDKLWEVYVAMLRYEETDLTGPTLWLTFMPRKYFTQTVLLDKQPITYHAYIVTFKRELNATGWTPQMHLSQGIEFPGHIVDHIIDDENTIVGIDYEFPTLGLKARKAFTEKLFHYHCSPASRVATNYIYRLYPLNDIFLS